MTRWLRAARALEGAVEQSTAVFTTIDEPPAVSSVLSVSSEGREIQPGADEAITDERREAKIVAAIRAGNHRPGAIATAAGLGATVTYQALDRMRARGTISVARDGHISLAAES